MTIFELGALGEFVSAVVVIITLLYLSVQLRQNVKWTKATVRHQLADFSQNAYEMFAQHSVVMSKFYLGETMTASEQLEARSVVRAVFHNWDNYRWQHEEGLLNRETWEGILHDVNNSARSESVVNCWWENRESYPVSLRNVIDPIFEMSSAPAQNSK
jgi:hypothetical protein